MLLAFSSIFVSLVGALTMRRQWLISRRFHFASPVDMYAQYFHSRSLTLTYLLFAWLFAAAFVIFYLYVASALFVRLSHGLLIFEQAVCLFGALLLVQSVVGGLRAVIQAGPLQWFLMIAGMLTLAVLGVYLSGGADSFVMKLSQLALIDKSFTAEGYSHYLAVDGLVPGLVSWVNLDLSHSLSSLVILACVATLAGFQISPALSFLAFANRTPKAFDLQQIGLSAGIGGLITWACIMSIAMGAHFLGANNDFSAKYGIPEYILFGYVKDFQLEGGNTDLFSLIDPFITFSTDVKSWFSGFFFVAIIAGLHACASLFLFTAAVMSAQKVSQLTSRTFRKTQRITFFVMGATVLLAALIYLTILDVINIKGLLFFALIINFQLLPALIAVCWWPFVTTLSIKIGLGVGSLLCVLAYVGYFFIDQVNIELYLLGGGFVAGMVNFLLVLLFSFAVRNNDNHVQKMEFQNAVNAGQCEQRFSQSLVPLIWVVATLWCFFAVGPGGIIGNTLFGDPMNLDSWVLGIPSLLVWKLLWWAFGLFLIGLVIYRIRDLRAEISES